MWRSIIIGLALICLALLGYYAVSKRAPQITAELEAAANGAVGSRLQGVRVEVSQRDALIKGTVATPEDRSFVEQTVAAIPGIKAVDTKLLAVAPLHRIEEPKGPDAPPTIEPPARPATLKATWDGKAVHVSGDLPAELKKELAALVPSVFPSAAVTDTSTVVGGVAAADVSASFKAALRALGHTTNGTLAVGDGEIELTGQVATADADAAVRRIVETDLKAFMSTVTITSSAPVDADVVADTIEEVVAAEDAESPADVVEEVALAADVEATEVVVLPAGALTNAQCQVALDQAVEGEKRITFAGPTGTLSPEGIKRVEEIWTILQRCPNAGGTIVGFHDNLGEPDKMRQRTAIRAFSVRKKLIELGMDEARFKTSGQGQRDFKYSNAGDTRVLNQRVEFRIEVQ